jgi:exopolysaccharide production protein ExoZ
VVIFHTGFVFPHMQQMGKFGVDIFFVISGYIMARICETDASFFLRRRLIRIVPPYWAMTLLLFLFARRYPRLLLSTHPSVPDFVKSLLFIPYYKMDLLRPILYVGWSLNYEMCFYVAIAAGLFLVPKYPLLFASSLLFAIQILCHAYAHLGAIPDFYGRRIIYEFVLGILAYEIACRVPERIAFRIRPHSLLALFGALAGIVCLQGIVHQPFALDWLAMQVLSMLVVLSASLLSQADWDIRIAWVVLVGDSSYILYLVHPYVEVLFSRVVSQRFHSIDISRPIGTICITILAVLVAVALHLGLERPLVGKLNRRFGDHKFKGFRPLPNKSLPDEGTRLSAHEPQSELFADPTVPIASRGNEDFSSAHL